MKNNLNHLIKISQSFGQNPAYIIAGGGNSSFKNKDKMWVKASGTSMAIIKIDDFVCLDRRKMQILSQKKYSNDTSTREVEVKQDLLNAVLSPIGKRPSVEASMHEIIQYAYIVHTHPTAVNGVLCAKNAEKVINEIFGDEVIYVPYTNPGYALFKEVRFALQKYRTRKNKEAQIIFLENHGVFVGANTCEEINNIYTFIEEKLKNDIPYPSDKNVHEDLALKRFAEQINIQNNEEKKYKIIDNSKLTQLFVRNSTAFSEVNIPFTPDNIVYCKSKYLFITDQEDVNMKIADFRKINGYYPKVIAYEGHGLICIEDNLRAAKIVLDVYKDMMKISYLSKYFGGPRPMTQMQINFIDHWEVENYRRKISKENK